MSMLPGNFRPAVVLTGVLIVLTGLIFPATIWGIGQLFFRDQANGSLVTVNGAVVGSKLIGQNFTLPEYFHPRPSAAGAGYDATASAGTNKGPTDMKLADTLIKARVDTAVQQGATRGKVPSDMVTASASGLDPHISPANAALQVARVATARDVDTAQVQRVVAAHTEGRQFGFFGEPRVNVLVLNIALDSAFGKKTQ